MGIVMGGVLIRDDYRIRLSAPGGQSLNRESSNRNLEHRAGKRFRDPFAGVAVSSTASSKAVRA